MHEQYIWPLRVNVPPLDWISPPEWWLHNFLYVLRNFSTCSDHPEMQNAGSLTFLRGLVEMHEQYIWPLRVNVPPLDWISPPEWWLHNFLYVLRNCSCTWSHNIAPWNHSLQPRSKVTIPVLGSVTDSQLLCSRSL